MRRCRLLFSGKSAQLMVKVREARKAYKKYYTMCFWSYDPNYKVTQSDLLWVSEQLKKYGNLETWRLGVKLCP